MERKGRRERFFTSNNPREAIIVKENPDTVDVWSNASFTSTGTQYIKTGDSTVQVKDSIKIQTAKITKGIYKLTTSLKVQGENEFITFDWDAGPGQTVTDTIEYHGLTPGKSYTVKGWLVDAETNAAAKGASGTEIRTESAQTAAASGRDKNSRHPVQNDCCQCVLYDVKI